jgi:hypothetical protein
MEMNFITNNGHEIAVVTSREVIVCDLQTALDLIADVSYGSGCSRMIINMEAICGEFFDLSTRLAGDILQKVVNYQMKLAIVGDFSIFTSKSLKDFIYESNNGNHIFFLQTKEHAIEKLTQTK